MKHPAHGKETEQSHILNFLTYSDSIRRGAPKPPAVHDRLEQIVITLPAALPAAGPWAETACKPPFFRPPRRRAVAYCCVQKKKTDTNRVAKSGQRRWRLTAPVTTGGCVLLRAEEKSGHKSCREIRTKKMTSNNNLLYKPYV